MVKENDKNREKELRGFELNIIRFTNDEVLQNIDDTLKKLEEMINLLKENPHSLFPPSGRGKEKRMRVLIENVNIQNNF